MDPINLVNNNMLQFTMYENLKTGNIIIDMILSTLAVSFFTTVGIFFKDNINYEAIFNNKIFSLCNRKKNNVLLEGFYVVRSWNGTVKTDFPIVIDALFWYIGNQEDKINKIKLHTPNVNSFVGSVSDDEDNDCSDRVNNINILKKKLIFRPQNATKFIIDDIEIDLFEQMVENEKGVRENLLYNLKIYLKDNSNDISKIKNWLENIQTQYETHQKKQLDKQKKIFTMTKQEDIIEWYEEEFISGKTWDNLFCLNKDIIKNKLDFFINNKSWYKKRGIPWTFGVLTYGPPGCGKTSLEKVFINYLDRHGVQLNIDENTTYKEIREIFYNPYINGKFIPLKKRIYIIPDIDAMGKVLLKRSESNDSFKNLSFLDKNLDNNSDGDGDNDHFIEENTDVDKLEIENTILKNENKILEQKIKNYEKPNKHTDSNYNIYTPGSSSLYDSNFFDLMKKKNHGITLSQILNLLDGIVELDGRVLIACTNHVNKLDPALIRPGRIDCVVELGLCDLSMIKQIIENFYETTITIDEIKNIEENKISPCKVYEICFRNTNNMKEAIKILQDI